VERFLRSEDVSRQHLADLLKKALKLARHDNS
jgi:hypothetical protein